MALRLRGATSGYIELKAPASAGDNTLTLPTNNGSANQLLKTDGSGNLSWTDDNSGVSLSGSTNNTIATVTGANALIGEANLTFDGSTLLCNGGVITAEKGSIPSVESKNSTSSSYARFYCSQTSGSGGYASFQKLGTTSSAIGGANATQIWCTGDAPLVIGVNGGEKLRITSGGNVNIGGDYSQTDSKVTIVDATKPIAEGTLNLQSSATTGAADTGAVLRFYGHSGTEARYHSSIKGAKENGTSGNYAGYLAFNTRPNGAGMLERLRITSDGKVGIGTTAPTALVHISSTAYDPDNGAIDRVNYPLVVINPEDANGDSTGIGFAVTTSTTKLGAAIHHVREAGGSQGDLRFLVNYDGNNITERLRIDSSGRVGINTSTHPDTSSALSITNGSSSSDHCILDIRCDDNETARVYFSETSSSGYGGIKYTFTSDSNHMGFFTNGNAANKEKVRIPKDTWGLLVTDLDASGNTGGYQTEGVSLRYSGDSTLVRTDGPPVTMTRKGNAGKALDFYSGTNYAGGVYVNGQNSADYQSTSDYRLKDNVNTMSDGISKIKQLNPIYFTNKQIEGVTDTTTVYTGFLAHEVKSVIPTLVDGEKDAFIDHQGKGYQSLSYGRFSPTLVAALKEAIAKIETLETKVAALESA